jgi:hypothetical protein
MRSVLPFSICEYLEMILPFFDGDIQKMSVWMNEENIHLGNVTPLEMFFYGNRKKLIKWTKNRLSENEL